MPFAAKVLTPDKKTKLHKKRWLVPSGRHFGHYSTIRPYVIL
jgi:hypothetical protein